MKDNWFEVDKEGLKKLLKRNKTRSFLVYELVQNAWDEASKTVTIHTDYNLSVKTATIRVMDDNPEGFKNLLHAYTLFAESDKKSDPTKRGRFNIGEKLVIACSINSKIKTTKGTIFFHPDGTREHIKQKNAAGSSVEILVKMSHTEYLNILADVKKLISPGYISTYLNGKRFEIRRYLRSFQAILPTEISDEEGNLRPTERKTTVNVYESIDKPTIYEMGIPVVIHDGRFDINIQQKVPLNIDRNNITPGYLRKLRTYILNNTFDIITEAEATEPWIAEATESKEITKEAITKVVELKYGEDRVSYDVSDPEANKIAMSKGYSVVTGGSFSKKQWDNIRKHKALRPAGKVTPSPKPFSPDGSPLSLISEDEWTDEMHNTVNFIQAIGLEILSKTILVRITDDKRWEFEAAFGTSGMLTLSKCNLGEEFFEGLSEGSIEEVSKLIIHEFAHHYCSDHLSSKYHETLCKIGAKIAQLAIKEPDLFKQSMLMDR